jgi:L-asparaginase II
MLALARQLNAEPHGYSRPDHPVQRLIAKTMGELCDVDLDAQPCGIDGCSVPTWAIPLRNLALGFARFTAPEFAAAQRIIAAVRAHPFMVAGSGDFDSLIMEAVPRLFVKTGAEGVYCACVPHAGLGIALKIDDGASRASEVAIASVLAGLDVWTAEEKATLERFRHHELLNWRRFEVGEVRGLRL